jgi:hypothetical protein
MAFALVGLLASRAKLGSPLIKYVVGGGFLLFMVLKGAAPGGAGARANFDAARATPLNA